jgi:ABC-2 type transport system permease protein
MTTPTMTIGAPVAGGGPGPTLKRIVGIARSEAKRLTRWTFAGVGLGVIAFFAFLATFVTFMAGNTGSHMGAIAGLSIDLESSSGIVAGLTMAADLIGIVILALWAAAVSSDYSTGWVRITVQAEPRRWRLVAGKLLTLTAFTLVATTIATVISVVVAVPLANAADVSTAAWSTGTVGTIASAWFNLTIAVLVWGTIGLTIAMVTRSAIVAIAGGIGYLMVFEGLLGMVADEVTAYLPGSILDAVVAGGNATLAYGPALALAALFGAVAIGTSTLVFGRRDVTS